jgi:hypothetical protein
LPFAARRHGPSRAAACAVYIVRNILIKIDLLVFIALQFFVVIVAVVVVVVVDELAVKKGMSKRILNTNKRSLN